MKTIKKALALILTLAIVMSLGITAFATATGTKDAPAINISNGDTGSLVLTRHAVTAYKLFDLKWDDAKATKFAYTIRPEIAANGFTYTAPTEFIPSDGVATTDVTADNLYDYLMSIDGDSDALQKFAQFVINDASCAELRAALPQDTVTPAGETASIDLKVGNDGATAGTDKSLGLGYYLVTVTPKRADGDKTGSTNPAVAAALVTTKYNAAVDINLKVEAPKIEKHVSDTKIAEGAKIGDVLTFTLETKIPDYTGYKEYHFIVSDTMTEGLTFVPGSGVVYIEDSQRYDCFNVKQTVNKIEINLGTSYDEDLLTALFDYEDLSDVEIGNAVKITYQAKLNDNSVKHDFETNKAHLEYSTQPHVADGGTKGSTPDSVNYVYDMGLDIDKIDGADSSKLPGAQFVLRDTDSKGTSKYYKHTENLTSFVTVNPAVSGAPTVSELTDAGVVLTTDSNGSLGNDYFKGLKPGTYYLEEIQAPEGYNLLKKDIKIVIADDSNSGAEKPTKVTYTITDLNAAEPQEVTQTYSFGDEPAASADVKTAVTVENNSGNELPSTGGIGTTIFYTVGAVMMATALVLLITKKKVSAN